MEAQKKVLVLSNLLQISSLISSGADLNEILNLTVDRIRQLGRSSLSFLILLEDEDLILKFASGEDSERFLKKMIDKNRGLLGRIYQERIPLILDKKTKISSEHIVFQEEFRIKNSIALPILSKEKEIGILGMGNSERNFEYTPDDLECLEIFSKQIAIAIENDLLINKIKGLEIKDILTGLYNERFIRTKFEEEIRRAIVSQRPCGFILLNVDNFREFYEIFGELVSEASLKKISSILEKSVSEIDYVGRIGDHAFSIILPEKNKKRTIEVAEEIRKRIEFAFIEEELPLKRLTVSGAVTENPLDGTTSKELFDRAKILLSLAEQQGKNKIYV